MSSDPRRGRLFVVSAPSGAGKTTVAERLVQVTPGLRRSRSYTSRRARPGEEDGVAYNFVSRDRFEAMIAGDQFLEWAEYSGNLYGTSVVDTDRELEAGTDLVLVIDVQGARQVRRHRESAVLVFLLPPSAEALEARLRGRSHDSEEQIRRRLQAARMEVTAVSEYDYVVVNDTLETCVERLRAVVEAERALAAGIDLVLVIDVQGARQVRRHRPSVASVFVLPPSFEVLESRLRGRSKDSEEQIRRRLETARREVVAVPEYDYVVINDEIDACVERLRAIIVAERAKPDVMGGEVASILSSFGVDAGRG